MAEESLKILADLGTIVETNKTDCNVLADKLDSFYGEHEAFIQAARQTYQDVGHPTQAKLRQKYQPRFSASWRKFQPVMKRCKDNAAIKALLDRVFP